MSAFLHTKHIDTLIIESNHPDYTASLPIITSIAELTSSFESIHVYKICETSLWQAAALGFTPRFILEFLREASFTPIPYPMQQHIANTMTRWGQLVLQPHSKKTIALTGPANVIRSVEKYTELISPTKIQKEKLIFPLSDRAVLKRELTKIGYPVVDNLGFVCSDPLFVSLREGVILRPYQEEAVTRFFTKHQNESGVIVLPCGSGKTMVGIAILAKVQMHTLIVVPNDMVAIQWKEELLARTTILPAEVQLYTKPASISPVTIVTYQKVAAKTRSGTFQNLDALVKHVFGLVIYDEVHMLPAPLFRLAAQLHSTRRLGLTATLVREDGNEKDVFAMIGPKCFEKPWKALEQEGYIAHIRCVEIRIPLPDDDIEEYLHVKPRSKYRIAANNQNKISVVDHLCRSHKDESILIMGHYIDFLQTLSLYLDCPFLHGNTAKEERRVTLQRFREGKLKLLVLSRIANMGIDIPCATIAIQISGLFGSRQEEAQRLGRILRPHASSGVFYSLVSEKTVEERLAKHRHTYLVEQGYAYEMMDAFQSNKERMDELETVGVSRYR